MKLNRTIKNFMIVLSILMVMKVVSVWVREPHSIKEITSRMDDEMCAVLNRVFPD